ncbi:MAG: integrase [Rhizobium sp.]|nr:integrase [Rhizobium sp.]
MPPKQIMRYLKKIHGRWFYNRRVPEYARINDSRYPRVVLALRTADDETAIIQRNKQEAADNRLWAALKRMADAGEGREAYFAAQEVREAFGLPAKSPASFDIDETRQAVKILRSVTKHHVDHYGDESMPRVEGREAAKLTAALFGQVDRPKSSTTEAMNYVIDTISKPVLAMKSPAQTASWKRPKLLAVKSFVEVCGDKPLVDIEGDDALAFFDSLEGRMLEPSDKFGYDAAKRQLADMRQLHADWCLRHKLRIENPFDGLKLRPLGKIALDKERPAFTQEWIETKILGNPKISGMAAIRRHALFVIAETGARPGEIINLQPSQIKLGEPIPHIEITVIDDGEVKREIKTKPSIRKLPLVGAALAAMRHHPDGFPKLFDKGNSFSAAVNKFLRENDMMESPSHTVYSLRHAAEDRLKVAGLGRVDTYLIHRTIAAIVTTAR